MKPFNLEAAKAGAPLVTRDGRPAKFIAHVAEAHPSQRLLVPLVQILAPLPTRRQPPNRPRLQAPIRHQARPAALPARRCPQQRLRLLPSPDARCRFRP